MDVFKACIKNMSAQGKTGETEKLPKGLDAGKFCRNFYIFKKFSEVEDKSSREYMQYFATKKCESEKMKRIQDIVDKYRKDTITRKAYMTLEQKLNIRYKNGLAKGEEEGRVKCRKEGRAEANKELAKAFCDAGVKVISEKTGLTPEEIKAL